MLKTHTCPWQRHIPYKYGGAPGEPTRGPVPAACVIAALGHSPSVRVSCSPETRIASVALVAALQPAPFVPLAFGFLQYKTGR